MEKKGNPQTKNGRSNLPFFKVYVAIRKVGAVFGFVGIFVGAKPFTVVFIVDALREVAVPAKYACYLFVHTAASFGIVI